MEISYYGVIYKITNLITDKYYFGKTINFEKRKKKHITELNNKYHHSSHLQKSWNKYGEKAFKFGIFDYAFSKEELEEKEDYYILTFKSYQRKYGYNILVGNHPNNKELFNKKEIRKICYLYLFDKKSSEEIAKLFKCVGSTIVRVLKKNNILLRDEKERIRLKYEQGHKPGNYIKISHRKKVKIVNSYIIERCTLKQVSIKYNYSIDIILRVLDELGVKPRTNSEAKMGSTPWNKDKKGMQKAWNKGIYRKIYNIDLDKVFNNVIIAAKECNCHISGIRSCCIGKRQTAGGYHWMYYEDYEKMQKEKAS